MIAVKYNKAGGNVIIKITINAPMMHWSYRFQQKDSTNDTTFTGTSEDDGLGNIRKHSLGFPNDLKGERDIWEFGLANLSEKEQAYEIKIEWIQDQTELKNGVLKDVWIKKGTVDSGKPENITDAAILI